MDSILCPGTSRGKMTSYPNNFMAVCLHMATYRVYNVDHKHFVIILKSVRSYLPYIALLSIYILVKSTWTVLLWIGKNLSNMGIRSLRFSSD